MQAAIDSGRIVSGTQQTFVRNRLVVVTPADNPAGLASLQDLAKPGIKIVLAAKEVPIGQHALDFFDKAEADGSLGAGYKDAVLANVVSYEENVRSVLAKVALGEADAGIVYTSDATAHGYYNLFRVKPQNPERVERLTTEARDHADPTVLPDGRLFFVAYEKSHSDVYEYTGGGGMVRRTDVTTGLFEPCPGPDCSSDGRTGGSPIT